MNNNRIQNEGRLLIGGIFLIIFALCLFGLNHKYMMSGKAPSINKMLFDNDYNLDSETILKEDYCMLTVDSSLGEFAESTRKIGSSGDTYYIVLLDDNSVMIVKVARKKDNERLDLITSETYASQDYYAEHTITLEGKVKKIDDPDIRTYYDDALTDLGIKGAENNKIKMRYIYLDATQNKEFLWIVFIVCLGGGIFVLFGGAISSTMEASRRRKEAAAARDNEAAPYNNDPHINMNDVKNGYDFNTPEQMVSNNGYLGEGTVMDKEKTPPPRFGDGERHERTEDGKVAITGRNLIK